MKSRLATFLTTFGLICLILTAFLFWQRITPRRLSFNLKTLPSTEKTFGALEPKTLVIKDLGIELPILPAWVKEGKWEASTKGVSYLSTSPVPGEAGNSILYGHNWSNLLGNLVNIKPGQGIDILFNDGSVKKFVVKITQTVTPEQTGILDPSDDKIITLYTCTGWFDQKRWVVKARLLE